MNKNKVMIIVILAALVVSGMIFSIPKDADKCDYDFRFTEYTLNNLITKYGNFSLLEFEGCNLYGEIGEPLLPIYIAKFVMPKDKILSNLSYKWNNNLIINISNPIYPSQPDNRCSELEPENFTYNTNTYNSTEWLYKSPIVNQSYGYARGFKILDIELRPVNYLPKESKIKLYRNIIISFKFEDGTTINNELYRGLNEDINYVKYLVENPNAIVYEDIISMDENDIDYLIITNDYLKDEWIPLKQHRENYSGLSVGIYSIESIDSNSDFWNSNPIFNDSAAHLREFLKYAYINWNTQYVLLGGNWRDIYESQHIVPYREMSAYPSSTDPYDVVPSDIYYSNLDGTFRDDDVWGGGISGINDKYSELYIGRITAYNASMVSNAIQKIIWYDNCEDGLWLRTVTFAGSDLGWAATSKDYMEDLRTGTGCWPAYVGFEEWNINHPDKFLDTSNRWYDEDGNWPTEFISSIENDNSSIINQLGHSSWSIPFSLSGWQYRYNTKPFFGYTQGCLAGRYSSGYSGCEQLICKHPERHAFALILNTGYGYGSYSTTAGPSEQQQKIFWDYFFNVKENNEDEWQLGKAHTYMKNTFISTSGSSVKYYVWYCCHLFGDPAQKLKFKTATTINIIPGHNYITYEGPNTTTKNIAISIGIKNGESILIELGGTWYAWIQGFTPDEMNQNVVSGDLVDVRVSNYYTWVIG